MNETRCDKCGEVIEGAPHVTGPPDKQVTTCPEHCWCAVEWAREA